MSDVPTSLLVRVAVPLVTGSDGLLALAGSGCVVLSILDAHEWMVESEGVASIAGWAVYWYHPHSHAVGLLYVLGPTGQSIALEFEKVWRAVDPAPFALIRRTAQVWLADREE